MCVRPLHGEIIYDNRFNGPAITSPWVVYDIKLYIVSGGGGGRRLPDRSEALCVCVGGGGGKWPSPYKVG